MIQMTFIEYLKQLCQTLEVQLNPSNPG